MSHSRENQVFHGGLLTEPHAEHEHFTYSSRYHEAWPLVKSLTPGSDIRFKEKAWGVF